MDLTSVIALASPWIHCRRRDSRLINARIRLDDNRHYFPPYDAAPVARAETLLRYPEVRLALERLSGKISADDMRALNYAADVEHRDISTIAREFIAARITRESRTSP